jgi:hypothetical protein
MKKLLPSLTIALLAGFALAVLTAHGCAGNCGTNCPANIVQIGSPDGAPLAIPNGGLAWSGPACPPGLPTCLTSSADTICNYIDVYGSSEGACDLTISFSDRPAEIVHIQFGPRITQGCCSGFQIEGPEVFYVPSKGLIYADGGTDAVSLVPPDASADGGDGGVDGGDAAQ